MLDAVCFCFSWVFLSNIKNVINPKFKTVRQSLIYIKVIYSTGRADTFCQIRNTKRKMSFKKLNDVLKSTKVLQCCFSSLRKNSYQQFLKTMIDNSHVEKNANIFLLLHFSIYLKNYTKLSKCKKWLKQINVVNTSCSYANPNITNIYSI